MYQPHQLYSQTFVPGGQKFVFSLPLSKQQDTNSFSWPPTYFEISWNSLSNGYYCRLGLTLLSSETKCPQEKYCPSFKKTKKGGCTWYSSTPSAYSSIYNVYPRISKKFEDPIGKSTFAPMLAVRYHDSPILMLSFTNRGASIEYIDGIVFYPKMKWITAHPSSFLTEGLGFKMENVHAVEFRFIKETFRLMLRELMEKRVELRQWLALKFALYMKPGDTHITERRGFKAFQRLDQIVSHALGAPPTDDGKNIIKFIQEGRITDEFLDFVEFVLLHTLAHTFKSLLVETSGCRPEDLGYYVEHPLMRTIGVQSGDMRIILYETAVGGFGYLRTLADGIRDGTKEEFFVEPIAEASKTFTKSCVKKSQEEIDGLAEQLAPFEKEFKDLVSYTLKAYSSTFPGTKIYPHVNSVRRAIANVMPEISPEVRPLIDDALGKGPHCWDGCQLCVMLERECNFMPFDQPFLVSRDLLVEALSLMAANLREPRSFSPLRKAITKEFDSFLDAAQHTIDLVSPWISPEIVEKLRTIQLKRSVAVRIITKEDPSNKTQVKTLQLLKTIQQADPELFQARMLPEIHAKGMLVDQVCTLHGSFNFTNAGLESNVENVTCDFSPDFGRKFLIEFEGLWKQSTTTS